MLCVIFKTEGVREEEEAKHGVFNIVINENESYAAYFEILDFS